MNKIKLLAIIAVFASFLAGCGNNSKAQKQTSPSQATQASVSQQTNQTAQTTTDPAANNQTTSVQNTDTQTATVTTNDSNPWKKLKPNQVNRITSEQFKQLIFDYTKSQVWKYKGTKPCVIDFYADWCRPCRYVGPIMEELAKEYNGKVYFFKVNVDNEQEVAQVFGIRSIPSVLFVPVKGQPRMAVGAMQKEAYIKAIEQICGVKLDNQGK